MIHLTYYQTVASFLIVFLSKTINTTIVLEENGYSNIVVAISEEIEQPDDGGLAIIASITGILTETSTLLYRATNETVYFKDIHILIPPKWNTRVAVTTTEHYYQNSDIRVTNANSPSAQPFTIHSGKCGVAGNFVILPIDYLADPGESVTVKAKALLHQWAQFRYGVFEEYGFSGDNLLPYFYRHPDGYDAVTSSNDTVVEGSLLSLSDTSCEVDSNGTILYPNECRFEPNTSGQTATTSIMSFYWVNSVVGFSKEGGHDRRPPHRQNRLCSSMSSSEIIFKSPDFINTSPKPGGSKLPRFRLIKNTMLPVLYLAIDTSQPSSPDNGSPRGLNILKGSLQRLFAALENYPDIYVAWSTFEDIDYEAGFYLNEEMEPTQFKDAKMVLNELTNNLTFSSNITSRDVSAVVRDAEMRLNQYKNTGGSILYIITSTEATTNDTVTETLMAEKLLVNNIKILVAESGPGLQSLTRFSVLSQGSYYYKERWETTAFFTPIKQEIENLCQTGLKNERRVIKSITNTAIKSTPWEGSFFVDETIGTNTTIVIELNSNLSVTAFITSPNGDSYTIESDETATNWNAINSSISVNWLRLNDLAQVGEWKYALIYDLAACEDECETEAKIHFQISSSVRSQLSVSQLPVFRPWVSLTAGVNSIDLSQHPAVIQGRFEFMGGWIGDLTVTADVLFDKSIIASVTLTDTGTMDSDISHNGVYSAVFYPEADGMYTINYYARQVGGGDGRKFNNFLKANQGLRCCGSSSPTTSLEYFETTINEAITFEVFNSMLGTQNSAPFITDLLANTYGVDENLVCVQLTWTVPPNTRSQKVRYSEDYNQLLDDFHTAPEALIVFGSLDQTDPGSQVLIYVATPYNVGVNVYLIVETTGENGQSGRSHLVWTEPYPPENPFTTSLPLSTSPYDTTTFTITDSTTPDEYSTTSAMPSTLPNSDGHSTTIDVTSTFPSSYDPYSTTDVTTNDLTTEIPLNGTSVFPSSTNTETIPISVSTDSTTEDLSTKNSSIWTNNPVTSTIDVGLSTSYSTKLPDGEPNNASGTNGYIIGGVLILIALIAMIAGNLMYKKKYTGHSTVKVDPAFKNEQSTSRKGRYPPPLLNPPTTVLPAVNGTSIVKEDETQSAQVQRDVPAEQEFENKKNS